MKWLGLLTATFAAAPVLRAADEPNVVVFLADDLSVMDCSPFGGKDVPTPNMARLAKVGMTFTQAFVASPSCAPSRAALLTGLDPMRNGAMLNHARPKAELQKWPAYFQALGYEVAAIGKVAHYAQVTGYGFDHASHFKYHEDECVGEAVKWLAARKSEVPLCLLTGDMQNRRIVNQHLAEAGARAVASVESNSTIALVSHVQSGGWASIVPKRLADMFAGGGGLVSIPLVEPEAEHIVGLIAPKRDPQTPILAALLDEAERLARRGNR